MFTDGALTLALGAGVVAALNPCGFALLPAYLALFMLEDQPTRRTAVARALRATTAMTAGFAGVFVLFGLAIAPVASGIQQYLPGFTVLLGLLVAAAGVWVLTGRRLPTLQLRRTSGGRPPLAASVGSMAGFGASYAVASLGCTIAPFLAVVVTAFRSGSTTQGVVLFAAYAAGMGLVVGTAAVAVALARTTLIGRIRRTGRFLARLCGALLLVAGGYVAWYGAWELRVLHGGAGVDPVVDAAGRLQQWLAGNAQAMGALGFLAVLAVFLLLTSLPRWRRSTGYANPQTTTRTRRGDEMKMRAVFNGTVIAESDDTVVVEGNHYFPEESLRRGYFTASTTHSLCFWKGMASYYTVGVDGVTSRDAAWFYPKPSPLARKVKGRVAFWRGVQVVPVQDQADRSRR